MLYEEYLEQISRPGVLLPDPSVDVQKGRDGGCIVDSLYALPVEVTSGVFPRGDAIAIRDEQGALLGELLTCAGEEIDVPAFSAGFLSAYLADTLARFYGQPGVFSQDFVVVPAARLLDYQTAYLASSAVWGGFHHSRPGSRILLLQSTRPIEAVSGINLVSSIDVETAVRSIYQPYAFERFLKLYHLLELGFDRDLVRKIQGLNDDLKGIGQLLSSYESSELNRLKQMLRRCRKPSAVIECLNKVTAEVAWHAQIKAIFFEFGKDGNPLKNKEGEFMDTLAGSGYTLPAMQQLASISGKKANTIQQQDFEQFSLDLAAYWIYRVRSSIAHSRIGEYVMQAEDEPFVGFFAEPLIRTVLCYVL